MHQLGEEGREIARAKAYTKKDIRTWGRQGGRPGKLCSEALARLWKLLARGKSQAESASLVGVSVPTIGRAAAGMKRGENEP